MTAIIDNPTDLLLSWLHPPRAQLSPSIVREIENNPSLLKPLIEIACGDHYPHAYRAGWVLNLYAEKYADSIRPYSMKLINRIPQSDNHSQASALLRILLKVKPDPEMAGLIIDPVLEWFDKPHWPMYTRLNAFQFIEWIGVSFPDLIPEFKNFLHETRPYLDSRHLKKKSLSLEQKFDKLVKTSKRI